MVRRSVLSIGILAAMLAVPLVANAVHVGDAAPDFTGMDSNGKTHKLSDYRGKYVVLEWTNNGCPYTQKHYNSGNMQALQKEWTAKGVVWLTVLSSAPGEQGYMTAAQENSYMSREKASPTAALLDPTGAIGHEYSAKTTPHMFVIDPSGKLIYDGAIDDHATTDLSDVKVSKNYVSAALNEAMVGQPVAVSYTRPYGCSVKYQ
ncbi:thioredoxin family protein [Alloacidobacterium sp.]|uniref:thioredoxin family protein n=1 Tax=Alloacidobacterium sp. TaxID=2951999 RepID=UPI002D54F7C7|nr:thioredoxin family protein [Alloacidobacterium sp.]HYK34495.1 thioredoxin family protein [Alloacidobacterium sp.]